MMLALALMQAAQTFSLEEARRMPPAVLADALLGAGHAPIAKVLVHPAGLDPPSASLQEVTMIGVPAVAPDKPGWCRRTDAFVHLKPLTAGINAYATAVRARVDRIEMRPHYRLATGSCASGEASFFFVRAEAREAQFALIDRLLAARDLARGKRPLPFVLRCTDQDGARHESFGGDGCSDGAGRTLLAKLPLERTHNVAPGGAGTVFSSAEPPRSFHHDAEIGMNDGSLIIDATIAEKDGRITAITLKRHIPYPF